MKYKTKCTDCGSPIVQAGPRSMERCKCGKKWGFYVYVDVNKKEHITLYTNGRPKTDPLLKKKKRAVTADHFEMQKIIAAGFTPNKLFRKAYRVFVLHLDS